MDSYLKYLVLATSQYHGFVFGLAGQGVQLSDQHLKISKEQITYFVFISSNVWLMRSGFEKRQFENDNHPNNPVGRGCSIHGGVYQEKRRSL